MSISRLEESQTLTFEVEKGRVYKNEKRKAKRLERKQESIFKKIRRFIRRVFLFLFLCLTLGVAMAGYVFYRDYYPQLKQYYEEACEIAKNSTIEDFMNTQTSYIYDSSGKQIAKLKIDKDINYVPYEDIPQCVIDATVAIEDQRFWQHKGVDFLSTTKAALLYLKNSSDIVRGGSTITQQLVKNIYLTREKSIERKIKEIFIALKLEDIYTKEQILEFYLNNINYANGYYGIGSATKGYFNKEPARLYLKEATFLAAIPNNPSLYDPLTNLTNTVHRREIILRVMKEQNYVTEEVYLEASNSPLKFYHKSNENYNYEVSYSIDCAVRQIMKKQGFNFKYSFSSNKKYEKYMRSYYEEYQWCKTLLYTGGYRVYTSLDSKVQKKLQKSIDKELKGFKKKSKDGIYNLQGAATVIDNETGQVIAIVGGRSQNFNNMITLNRAYQSFRQPGSTFKPIAVYTPAFELGYKPNTLVEDEYSEDGPKNSGDVYLGEINIRTAVEKSKNVIAWNLMKEMGPSYCLSYPRSMQFSKLVKTDDTLSASLGGLTYGVNTVEMASAYATLANDGVYKEPTCIVSITNSSEVDSDLIMNHHRVYSEDAARTMTDVLQGVAKRGTAAGLDIGGMPVACKTGTTNYQKTAWFCGYTPYYSVACYVGCDDNTPVSDLWGNSYPMYIWRDIQTFLNKDLPKIQFPKVQKKKKHKDKDKEAKADNPATESPDSAESPDSTDTPDTPADKATPDVSSESDEPAEEPTSDDSDGSSSDPAEDVIYEPDGESNSDGDSDHPDSWGLNDSSEFEDSSNSYGDDSPFDESDVSSDSGGDAGSSSESDASSSSDNSSTTDVSSEESNDYSENEDASSENTE